jgi:PAS domain S-box-containing protein
VTAIAQTATVAAPPQPRLEHVRFCTRCAVAADNAENHSAPYGFDRVCTRCGMGVMLTTPRKALQDSGAAFLVVTRDGRISAVSEAAERLVGEEAGLLGMPITTVVTSPDDETHLVRLLTGAAGGRREIVDLPVIHAAQRNARPGRLNARVASCGSPRAALLVLERAAAL